MLRIYTVAMHTVKLGRTTQKSKIDQSDPYKEMLRIAPRGQIGLIW